MLDVYRTYFKLSGEPFRLGPDHRFALGHRSYANAKAYLDYAINQGEGFIAVTGGPGTGKTTLIAEILAGLDKEHLHVATLTSTQLESRDLLHMVASSFGIQLSDASKANLLLEIEQFLNRELRQGRRAILIVDEAQGLSNSALEELRLLANMQREYQLLLQVFLVGQEQLLELIRAPGMEHLHQRLIATSSLEPLTLVETVDYIEHRLLKVGWKGDPTISEDALRLIHKFSGGVPRRINLICNRLFLYGGMEGKHDLSGEDTRTVIKDLQDEFLLEPGSLDDVVADAGSDDTGPEAGSFGLPRAGTVVEVKQEAPRAEGVSAKQKSGQERPGEKINKEHPAQKPVAGKVHNERPAQKPVAGKVRKEANRVNDRVRKRVDKPAMPDLDPDLTVEFKQQNVKPAVNRRERTRQPAAGSNKQKRKGTGWGKLAGLFLVIGGGLFYIYQSDQADFESLYDKFIAFTSSRLTEDGPLHAGAAKAVNALEGIVDTTDSLSIGDRNAASLPVREDSSGLKPDDSIDSAEPLKEGNPAKMAEPGEAVSGPTPPGRTDHRDTGLIKRQSVTKGQVENASESTSVAGEPSKHTEQDQQKKTGMPGTGRASSDESAAAVVAASGTAGSKPLSPLARQAENKKSRRGEKSETTKPQVKSSSPPAQPSGSKYAGIKSKSVVSTDTTTKPSTAPLKLAATSTVDKKDASRGESTPVNSTAKPGPAVPNAEAIQAQYQNLRLEAEQRFVRQQGRKTIEPVKRIPVAAQKPATVKKTPAPVRLAKVAPQEKKKKLDNRNQIRMTLLQGRWSSRGKPAALLPSEVTVCNSDSGSIICQSVPQDIDTQYGLALYKVKTMLRDFSDKGDFKVQYRTLVKLLGKENSERAKAEAESSDEGWQVTEYAMACRLIQSDTVSCRDKKGVTREYRRFIPGAKR